MLRIGTNHFTSLDSAVRYYHTCYPGLTRTQCVEWVKQKLKDGEVCIGPPELKENERHQIDPVEGRYFILEERR